MAYNYQDIDPETMDPKAESDEERKQRLARLAKLVTGGGTFSGAMEQFATKKLDDTQNRINQVSEAVSNPQEALEQRVQPIKEAIQPPAPIGPVMPPEVQREREVQQIQQPVAQAPAAPVAPAQPQFDMGEFAGVDQAIKQQQVQAPAAPVAPAMPTVQAQPTQAQETVSPVNPEQVGKIPQPGPAVQVASTQPGAGVQEAAQAAQQAPMPSQTPEWHEKLTTNNVNTLSGLLANPNTPEDVKAEAQDRLYNMMTDKRIEQKANSLVDRANSGDPKAVNDLTREISSRGKEGSLFKAVLYGRLGLTELARDEQAKLGAGAKYSSFMDMGGQHYTIKQDASGLVTSAFDSTGKRVDEATLSKLNSNYMGQKGIETGMQQFKDAKGDIYTFSKLPGQAGGIYTNTSTGESSRIAPKGMMPLTYQNPLEKAAIGASKTAMDNMRRENAKAEAQGAPAPYSEEQIQAAGDAASSALLSGRGGLPGMTQTTTGEPIQSATGLSANLMKKASSGDRSVEKQQAMYDESVAAGRPGKTAQGMPIAKPGTSKHEGGNALDFPPSSLTKEDRLELARAGWYQPLGTDSVHWEPISGKGNAPVIGSSPKPAGISDALETQAQAIARGEAKAPSGLGAQNYRARAIMDRVYQINPSFDPTKFEAMEKARKDFTTGKQGDTVRSMNVSIDHLAHLQEAADALHNGKIPIFNKVANEYAKQTGQKAPTDFDGMKTIVGAEVAKAIQGGATALGDREEIRVELNNARSPEQLAGLIKKYQGLLGGQLTGLRTQYEEAGLKDFDSKLNERTKRVLGTGKEKEKQNTRSSW